VRQADPDAAREQVSPVPFEPFDRRTVGRTDLAVTILGLGSAPLAGMYVPPDEDAAVAVVERSWDLGYRYFDTAPLYGYGLAERILGRVLAGKPRDEFVLSTKVGRLVRREGSILPGADVDNGQGSNWPAAGDARAIFDYSGDGVRRSIDESLGRLGLDRIDVVYIHDPDDHWETAIGQAFPALHALRAEGIVRAIGAGMNQSEMLARFAREGEFDMFMLAGRYTLLDHDAFTDLLPLCVKKDISIAIAGAMNSGVLADPRPGSKFNYATAPAPIVERAVRLREACARHGVPLRVAAAQFPLAHPAVATLAAGVRSIEHLDEYPTLLREQIPAALWDELRDEGLIPADAPTPS
jgi:D-threo-aldose 1-dehydrogenase